MTYDETTILLGFINGLDRRVAMSEQSISAWSNVLPESISLHDAMKFVREHYQETDKAVLPANIVSRHRMAATPEEVVKPEPTHDCIDGFVLVEEERNGQTITAAARCEQCHKSPRQ